MTRNSETVDIHNIRSILVITNIDKLQFDCYRFSLAGFVGTLGRCFSFSSGAKEGSVQSSISNLILELVKIYKNVRKIVFTPRLITTAAQIYVICMMIWQILVLKRLWSTQRLDRAFVKRLFCSYTLGASVVAWRAPQEQCRSSSALSSIEDWRFH